MGCVGSKRVDEEAAAYRQPAPAPAASMGRLDINTIGEPWLVTSTNTTAAAVMKDSQGHLPLQILEKLDAYDVPPQSWTEVSKALEDLKPTLLLTPPRKTSDDRSPSPTVHDAKKLLPPAPSTDPRVRKNQSFHTLEEVHGRLNSDGAVGNGSTKPLLLSVSPPPPLARSKSAVAVLPAGLRPVSQNSFVLRDKQETEKNNTNEAEQIRRRLRRDPLSGLLELCPPGGEESVVLYTTTLRGVRRTFEDCETARQTLESHCSMLGVEVDERDVSLHGEYLRELRGLLGEEAAVVPRLFVKGRYVGGVEEVVRHNEVGRLESMMRVAIKGSEGKGQRRGCGGCGGARFVPCMECSGSCKVLDEDGEEEVVVVRCGECNENGLVQCPICSRSS